MHSPLEMRHRPEDVTVHYLIEARGSRFSLKATATGMLSALGHSPTIAIPDVSGEIWLNPHAVEESSLRLVIPAASLAVADDINQKDRGEIDRRMHEEVLEADAFPNVVYESSWGTASRTGEGQYWVALNGDLSLHGVTRPQPVSARVSVNGDALHAVGEFSLRQSDYEIRPVTALGGAVRIKDELKFSFDICASRQS